MMMMSIQVGILFVQCKCLLVFCLHNPSKLCLRLCFFIVKTIKCSIKEILIIVILIIALYYMGHVCRSY